MELIRRFHIMPVPGIGKLLQVSDCDFHGSHRGVRRRRMNMRCAAEVHYRPKKSGVNGEPHVLAVFLLASLLRPPLANWKFRVSSPPSSLTDRHPFLTLQALFLT